MIRGIDVSEHPGKIQWSRVKAAGIGFAVIRAGYGRELSQKDAQFEANYAGCTSAGIPAGAYWYSYAVTPEEARQEAAVCLRVLRGKSFAFPVYFDLEERRALALGRAACTAIAQAFLETVEQAGYFVGIYSSKSHLENYLTEELRKRYAVWVAHYGVKQTDYAGQHGMWQYSSTGSVDGIGGNVDLNECYTDYAAIISGKKLNGYGAAPEKLRYDWKAGQRVQLDKEKTQLFANDTSATPAAYLPKGVYYIYDGVPCGLGRFRVTTRAEFCEKKPAGKYVTGYVSVDNFREV